VEATTKEKKEKENVLTYLQMVNLRSVSLLKFEEFKRSTIEVEKEKLAEANKEYQKNLQQL
jgi:hypothetical protein